MDQTTFDALLTQHQSQFRVVLAVIAKHPEIHKELRETLADHEAHTELTKAQQTRIAQLNALTTAHDELLRLITE